MCITDMVPWLHDLVRTPPFNGKCMYDTFSPAASPRRLVNLVVDCRLVLTVVVVAGPSVAKACTAGDTDKYSHQVKRKPDVSYHEPSFILLEYLSIFTLASPSISPNRLIAQSLQQAADSLPSHGETTSNDPTCSKRTKVKKKGKL